MTSSIYPIPGPWKGQLVILARPRGGDWLDDEMRRWRSAGIDMVVSLLDPEEQEELGLTEECRAAERQGIRCLSFSILDRSVPASLAGTAALLAELRDAVEAGKSVGVHCRQGIGRSSLIASGVLMTSGVEAGAALERVATARGAAVPDTPEQRAWLEYVLAEHLAVARANS
jgi:protein-tyrosine phosphatase